MAKKQTKSKKTTKTRGKDKKPRERADTYKPEFCDMLIEHMSHGLSLRAFCGKIKVHHQTVYNWLKSHPEFKQARDIGWDASLLFWESMGVSLASGVLRGNAAVWIMNMANRFKDDWKRNDVQEIQEDKKVTISLKYDPTKPREEEIKNEITDNIIDPNDLQ